MPWARTDWMSERMKFITAYLEYEASFTDLCRDFGVSRKTGYKWMRRHEADGPAAGVFTSAGSRSACWTSGGRQNAGLDSSDDSSRSTTAQADLGDPPMAAESVTHVPGLFCRPSGRLHLRRVPCEPFRWRSALERAREPVIGCGGAEPRPGLAAANDRPAPVPPAARQSAPCPRGRARRSAHPRARAVGAGWSRRPDRASRG